MSITKFLRLAPLALIFFFFTAQAHAQIFLTPQIGVGSNPVQGTYVRLGLDLGYHVDENLYAGFGAYYDFGNYANYDREIGAGPFVGYVLHLTSFLSVDAREDIDYLDQRDPVLNDAGTPYTYNPEYGVASITYAGVTLKFTPNFGLSAGYRAVLGLTNSNLGNGRSGLMFGLIFAI